MKEQEKTQPCTKAHADNECSLRPAEEALPDEDDVVVSLNSMSIDDPQIKSPTEMSMELCGSMKEMSIEETATVFGSKKEMSVEEKTGCEIKVPDQVKPGNDQPAGNQVEITAVNNDPTPLRCRGPDKNNHLQIHGSTRIRNAAQLIPHHRPTSTTVGSPDSGYSGQTLSPLAHDLQGDENDRRSPREYVDGVLYQPLSPNLQEAAPKIPDGADDFERILDYVLSKPVSVPRAPPKPVSVNPPRKMKTILPRTPEPYRQPIIFQHNFKQTIFSTAENNEYHDRAKQIAVNVSVNDLYYRDKDDDSLISVGVQKIDLVTTVLLLERMSRESTREASGATDLLDIALNRPNKQNQTPLYLAVTNAVTSGDHRFICLLMRYGANPNALCCYEAQNKWKCETALHFACRKGEKRLKALKELLYPGYTLNNRLDLDCINSEGKTALHLAVDMHWKPLKVNEKVEFINSIAIIRELLQHGATPDKTDKDGQTPLHIAAQKRDEIKRLFDTFLQNIPPKDHRTVLEAQNKQSKTCVDILFEKRSDYIEDLKKQGKIPFNSKTPGRYSLLSQPLTATINQEQLDMVFPNISQASVVFVPSMPMSAQEKSRPQAMTIMLPPRTPTQPNSAYTLFHPPEIRGLSVAPNQPNRLPSSVQQPVLTAAEPHSQSNQLLGVTPQQCLSHEPKNRHILASSSAALCSGGSMDVGILQERETTGDSLEEIALMVSRDPLASEIFSQRMSTPEMISSYS